jgi:hypothetical protein
MFSFLCCYVLGEMYFDWVLFATIPQLCESDLPDIISPR